MIRWGILFIILAIIATIFGFGGVAGISMTAAYWLIAVGVILFVLFAIFGRGGGGINPPEI